MTTNRRKKNGQIEIHSLRVRLLEPAPAPALAPAPAVNTRTDFVATDAPAASRAAESLKNASSAAPAASADTPPAVAAATAAALTSSTSTTPHLDARIASITCGVTSKLDGASSALRFFLSLSFFFSFFSFFLCCTKNTKLRAVPTSFINSAYQECSQHQINQIHPKKCGLWDAIKRRITLVVVAVRSPLRLMNVGRSGASRALHALHECSAMLETPLAGFSFSAGSRSLGSSGPSVSGGGGCYAVQPLTA